MALQDAAATHRLHCWLYLGETPDLPKREAGQPATNEQLLTKIVNAFKNHPALAAYKGMDKPRNPLRGEKWIRPDGLVRAYQKLKALDADHPMVIIQAPRSPVSQLTANRPAFDITGADIFPIAYPPGGHSDLGNSDISVVGDITQKMVDAAGGKPVWTTLKIAWTGSVTSTRKPDVVPRFPTLHEARFMAYQAIVSGARGLMFFGGHLTQVCKPADAKAGWNWTYWGLVLRPLLLELTSTAVAPALVAPSAAVNITASAQDIELVARQNSNFLYLIVVRQPRASDCQGFRPSETEQQSRAARSCSSTFRIRCRRRSGPATRSLDRSAPQMAASATGSGRTTCTSTGSASKIGLRAQVSHGLEWFFRSYSKRTWALIV